jgi:excisionase family DNA binding protein
VTDIIYINLAELKVRWALHIETIRRMIRAGQLPAVRFGTRLRVRLDDVETFEMTHLAKKEERS